MKKSKINKYNSQAFIDDLQRVKKVLVYAPKTGSYYNITKKELISDAETKHIDYLYQKILTRLSTQW